MPMLSKLAKLAVWYRTGDPVGKSVLRLGAVVGFKPAKSRASAGISRMELEGPDAYLQDFHNLLAPMASVLTLGIEVGQHEGHCTDPFCSGVYKLERPGDSSCSCHTGMAPCSSCENMTLVCNECGEEPEESFWQS